MSSLATGDHYFSVTSINVYGFEESKAYATPKAILKAHRSDGLNVTHLVRVRRGELVTLNCPHKMEILDITYEQYKF